MFLEMRMLEVRMMSLVDQMQDPEVVRRLLWM